MKYYDYNILKKNFQFFLNIFYSRKAFKIRGLKELHKIKQFIRNLKRRNFHSTSTEDGLEARFPNLKGNVEVKDIGHVNGAHTGPGTVAVFFVGDKR